jgi:hypothetical protein
MDGTSHNKGDWNMKKVGKIMLVIVLSFVGIIFIGILIVFANSLGKLTPLKDLKNNLISGSISEKVWVEVNGIKQGMLIRGENPKNPVILYLHGGPGTPMLQFISYSEKIKKSERIEKYFTVCYWDQRGAGMIYSKSTDPSTMTIEQMIEDTREVTLAKDGTFKLPGKRALKRKSAAIEYIAVDVTESPINRPKKNQKAYYSGKKNAAH